MTETEARRAFKKAQQQDVIFRRAEMFNKELMEDFRFMEAARMHSGEYEAANLNTGHLKPRSRFKSLMVTNPHGLINFAAYSHKLTDDQEEANHVVDADVRSLRFSTRMAKYPPLDIFARWLLNTTFFGTLMVIVILVNSVLIAVDLEIDDTKNIEIRRYLDDMDCIFLLMFLSEIILKFLDDFRGFWREGWNIFDFIVTSFSLIPLVLDIVLLDWWQDKEEDFEDLFQAVKYLRILRIFRSLNVVTRITKIRRIWQAVLKTFKELFFITLLMGIFFYIFAIIGIKIFERYTASHRTNLKYRIAFSNLGNAFVTLFQLFTLDHYAELINDMKDIEQEWKVASYIIIWIFMGSFIFRNIFTGVMVNNFQSIQQDLMEERSLIEKHKKLALELNIFSEEGERTADGRKKAVDPHLGWEEEVFHNMKIIGALQNQLSPTVWPRDTLFQYYMLLEAMASNLEEKNQILRLLDNALLHQLDP